MFGSTLQRIIRSPTDFSQTHTITYTATDESGNSSSASATVAVLDDKDKEKGPERLDLPAEYAFEQNASNPFNPSTEITYGLPKRSQVRLTIYNVRGQEVAKLVDREQPAGYYSVAWNASGMAGGIYLCQMEVREFKAVQKLMLVR